MGSRERVRRIVLAVLIGLVGIILVASLHPLTPARTLDAFELKARGTAKSALSSVETARLAARVATDGDAFGPYVSVLLSEAETGAGRAHETFLGIQPPDRRADLLRDRLDTLLSRADDRLAALRISARRGELERLERMARPLRSISRELNRFLARH
jgi:hypothetical protein